MRCGRAMMSLDPGIGTTAFASRLCRLRPWFSLHVIPPSDAVLFDLLAVWVPNEARIGR